MEQWREIAGFPGYEVSSLGRVRSWRLFGMHYGKKAARPRVLRPGLVCGYQSVSLMRNKKAESHRVCRLVLLAFAGPCPLGMEARHLNGKANDNRASNLAWSTRCDNQRDKVKHGTLYCGAKHYRAKLNPRKVKQMRMLYAKGAENTYSLAKRFGVSQAVAWKIVARKAWKSVA
jgi:hypothetical protein